MAFCFCSHVPFLVLGNRAGAPNIPPNLTGETGSEVAVEGRNLDDLILVLLHALTESMRSWIVGSTSHHLQLVFPKTNFEKPFNIWGANRLCMYATLQSRVLSILYLTIRGYISTFYFNKIM